MLILRQVADIIKIEQMVNLIQENDQEIEYTMMPNLQPLG